MTYDVLLMPTDIEKTFEEQDLPIRPVISIYLYENILKSLGWTPDGHTVAYIKDGELRIRQCETDEDENYYQFTNDLSIEYD